MRPGRYFNSETASIKLVSYRLTYKVNPIGLIGLIKLMVNNCCGITIVNAPGIFVRLYIVTKLHRIAYFIMPKIVIPRWKQLWIIPCLWWCFFNLNLLYDKNGFEFIVKYTLNRLSHYFLSCFPKFYETESNKL